MKVPCCSVCHTKYDEEERVPLFLQCGHGFCKECLSRMFSASSDTTLSCHPCRHLTMVGNSVNALRKNFAILALIHSSSADFDCDFTDDESEGDSAADIDDDEEEFGRWRRWSSQSYTSSSGCGGAGEGSVIDLASHRDLRLIRRLGEGRRAGVEMWFAVLYGGSSLSNSNTSSSATGRCRHKVAVKRVAVGDETGLVWVQNQLENLRRASMWCRNVCTFHGATRLDGRLCLVMDKYSGSIQSEMQQNEGRLTLEQILRYVLCGQSRDSIGTVLCVDDYQILRVGFLGASRGWKADPAEM